MHVLGPTIVSILTLISSAAWADPLPGEPPAAAPGAAARVHEQPRGSAFAPKSAEDEAVQRSITLFNEKQKLLDASFNRRLTICRRC